MFKHILIILGFISILIFSCKKQLPSVGGTSAQSIANEWWVTLTVGGQDVYNLGHKKLVTYNTSANNNEVWVDDLKNGYGFKVKAIMDSHSLTFSSSNGDNQYYDSTKPANFPKTVMLTEGKVLLNQGRSKSGNITDSIYFKTIFSDDPSTTYIISGHARTRFTEDDY